MTKTDENEGNTVAEATNAAPAETTAIDEAPAAPASEDADNGSTPAIPDAPAPESDVQAAG
jgi:hypothetical protein